MAVVTITGTSTAGSVATGLITSINPFSRKTSAVISSQVPEFIKADAPKFIEFLKAYYEFLEGYNLEITNLRDVDLSSDELVRFIKQEFVGKFPNAAVNDRILIKTIRQVYSTKGTISALSLLFKLFFNEAISVYQPNKMMLIASDGRWTQERSLTLLRRFSKGDYEIDVTQPLVLKIDSPNGIFFIDVDRITSATEDEYTFIYKKSSSVSFDGVVYIDIVDADGDILWRGELQKTPSYVEIKSPGKYWKVGQIFFINGSVSDTVCVVDKVSSTGEILLASIVEYGVGHTENQSVIISPFPNKPNSSTSLTSEIIGYNPILETYEYNYTLNISDLYYISEETITGIADKLIAGEHVIGVEFENVFEESYSPSYMLEDEYLTIEKWIESRATITYKFDTLVKYKGSYSGVEGHLSNPTIKIQDGYFYQMFSYVIESTKNYNDYDGLVNMIHPAGLKFFGDLAKTALITFGEFDISRTISRNKIYVDDSLDAFDLAPLFIVIKELAEILTALDYLVNLSINKGSNDTVSTSDASWRLVVAALAEISASSDYLVNLSINKGSNDTVSTSDGGSSAGLSTYDSETYFSENYAQIVTLLTIG